MNGHIQLLSAGEGFGTTALVDIPVSMKPKKRRARSDPSFDRSPQREEIELEAHRHSSVSERRPEGTRIATHLRSSSSSNEGEEESGVETGGESTIEATSRMTTDKNAIFEDCTVILAEDNDFSRTVIKAMLSKIGLEKIVEVGDGSQLVTSVRDRIEEINNGSCIIVLTDLEMPEVTGFDAMRQNRLFATRVPIIVLPAPPFPESRPRVQASGARWFFSTLTQVGYYAACAQALHQLSARLRAV
eukprot:TRINITY_DN12675_c0_g1_i1.p1 TRINITY_DN12675_c0_g1~~TRINITY_DN12675_c0_g1_i1.p1  ORF type:complete len:245 (-),score=28.82 TRINITY_DN12675_c0_g1_i1:9-743(-)